MAALVDSTPLKGFRDYLPEDMIPRNLAIEKIRGVFEKYGFSPIDTPVLENLATLVGTGGDDMNKEMFRLQTPEEAPVAMRFDLTVPFARMIAQYSEKLKLPFRRYHIGPVFRADKPSPGRYRQFTQFDIDAAGSESVAVDAEIIAAMCEALKALGLDNSEQTEFQVQVNNRKLVDALLEGCSISDINTQKHILRVVDKMQKVGVDNVRRELGAGRIDDSGDPIPGVKLEDSAIEKIIQFVSIKADGRQGVIDAVEKALPDSEWTKAAIQEMQDLKTALESLGVGEIDAVFDPSLARGLDYYTGPVFEAILPIAPGFGSVMGGGRYDGLVARFLEDNIPSTGASIGLDRLLEALASIGKTQPAATTTEAILIGMGGVPISELLVIAKELREKGVAAEVYMGAAKAKMRDQLSYANAKGIKVAVIIGSDELESATASVKDLQAGKVKRSEISDHEQYRKAGKSSQVTVARSDLAKTVCDLLGR